MSEKMSEQNEQEMAQPEVPNSQNQSKIEDKVSLHEKVENELHISCKSYKYPDKNTEGFAGGRFAKNGPFYGYPCCCCYWLSAKKEPETEVKCRTMQIAKNMGKEADEEASDNSEDVHDLEYKQLPDGEMEQCMKCQKKVDEFFYCEKCQSHRCLDCHKEPPRTYGCLCCKIDPGAIERKARAEAKEGFDDIWSQTKEMFRQLKAEDKDEEGKKEHCNELFNKFDTDGSGSLSLKELSDFLGNYIAENFGENLKKAAEKYQEVAEEFWGEMMDKLDKNGDGAVSLDEFFEVIMEVFEELAKKMFASIKMAYEKLLEEIDKLDGQ